MITKTLTTIIFGLVFFVNCIAENKTTFTTIFAHGLGGNADQGRYYSNFVGCSIIGQNGPEWDSTLHGSNIGPQKSCLAQDADIEIIEQQISKQVPQKIILLGVSKGAATMLTTVGRLTEKQSLHLGNIQAVILDSPFACPENVGIQIIKQYAGEFIGSSMDSSCIRPIVKKLETKLYPHYNPCGITPIKSVTQQWIHVDKNMVIVFVHSKKDQLISINDSRLLYRQLKKLGFNNVYLIEASAGTHGNVFWGPDENDIFKKLCLIYLKHNLPLPRLNDKDIEWLQHLYVEQGQQILAALQPSIKEINQRLHPWLSWFGFV